MYYPAIKLSVVFDSGAHWVSLALLGFSVSWKIMTDSCCTMALGMMPSQVLNIIRIAIRIKVKIVDL